MKGAIITGASSGIGRALTLRLHSQGYAVGIMARRGELLESLRAELKDRVYVSVCDVSQIEAAQLALRQLIAEMGEVDLVVLNAGTGHLNPELIWPREEETIVVNATAFAALANVAFKHFIDRGAGHLVGITSIGGLTGNAIAPAYTASKAFASNYLAGLRQKATQLKLPITVTDVMPGFVDTEMAKSPIKFWVASPAVAAEQIARAIQRKASLVYVTRRWRLIAWLFKLLPEPVLRRLG